MAQPVPDPQRESPLAPPKLIESAAPEYPPDKTGAVRVVVQLDIDEKGVPGNLAVLTPPQPGFDESALAAARKLRFTPAAQGGKPVAVRIQYAFNFVAPEKSKPAHAEDTALGPKRFVSFTPVHDRTGCGAFQRNSPTGGWANGTPR